MTDKAPTPEAAPKSDPPTSKGKFFIERLNAYRNLILAIAALATAVGSWFRPTDTTATKTSFQWTSAKIEELSKTEIKTHQDIEALRNFLDGYTKGQQKAATVLADKAADTSNEVAAAVNLVHVEASRRAGTHPVKKAIQPVQPIVVPAPPPLPVLKSEPKAINRPAFDALVK